MFIKHIILNQNMLSAKFFFGPIDSLRLESYAHLPGPYFQVKMIVLLLVKALLYANLLSWFLYLQ